MIALTGGGTGGHLSIVKNLKEEFNKKGIKPVFIGSSNGQDRSWFENDEGFCEKYFFDTKGVMNKGGASKFISLLNILTHSIYCYSIFKKHNIKKVISVGGYSAAPASFGAIIFKKDLYIHEQNAKAGSLNRKLIKFSKAFFCSYEKDSPVRDYPVDDRFFNLSRTRKELKSVIFLGGSQGAKSINALVKDIAPVLIKEGICVIHQCGKAEYKELKKFYEKNSLPVELYDFVKNMPELLNRADLAVSRSGASTLWELCANRLPAIFIPYPYAVYDHQYYNAEFLKKSGLCKIVKEDELNGQKIINLIKNTDLKKISNNLSFAIKEGGARKIAEYILSD